MNSEDLFHKAHLIILDGSKQASILVLAMIAGRGIWISSPIQTDLSFNFYIFSFISVICCIFAHFVYGFEFALYLARNRKIVRSKAWLYLSTFFLFLQIVSLFLSICFFIFQK